MKSVICKCNFCALIVAVLTLTPAYCHAQISIVADTISVNCGKVYVPRPGAEKLVINSQAEYEESEFFKGTGVDCFPFHEINEINVLIGFAYQGSNCDQGILRSKN